MSLRKVLRIIFLLVFLAGLNSASTVFADVNLSVSFNDALSPYGSWMNVGSYGNVWRPNVSAGFTPYTNGHWIYTSYGPTWVGNEPWAWSAYHYGRWVNTAQTGWVWIPGYEWHPGRVTWATSGDNIGWSPYAGGGSDGNYWVFVNRDRFGSDNYSNYILRRDTIRNMFDRRQVSIRSAALQRSELERIVRRPIRVYSVNERRILADRRSVRLVVPREHESRIIQQISSVKHRDGDRDDVRSVTVKETVKIKDSGSASHAGEGAQNAKLKIEQKSKETQSVVKHTVKKQSSKSGKVTHKKVTIKTKSKYKSHKH